MMCRTLGLLVTLALSLLATSRAAVVQPMGNVPHIGVLVPGEAPSPQEPNIAAFRQALQHLGYREGQTIVVEYHLATQALGLTIQPLEVRELDRLDHAFAALSREAGRALIVLGEPFFFPHRSGIPALVAKYRLPAIYVFRVFVDAGGLMSYGVSLSDVWRRAASYVDKILKGAKPGELPIEQPTTFELVINLKTAQALGLTIPPTLLFQADEVIR